MKTSIFFLSALLLVTACEKSYELADETKGDKNGNVTLVADVSTTTRASSIPLSDVCGRLNVAIFGEDGKKVKSVSQVVSDAQFGTVRLSLSEGIYTVVAIAHNCTGSATITSMEKVTFPNNKVTDTFYYSDQLQVTGEKQEINIELQRAVAMVRFVMTDNLLDLGDVAQLKFYYQGGSSTFSPAIGYGCVNSKQTEYRMFSEDGVYEVYTLPHSDEDVLTKMIITALDAGDNIVGECELENIPITINHITNCTGSFAGGGGTVSTSITVNPDWGGSDNYNF